LRKAPGKGYFLQIGINKHRFGYCIAKPICKKVIEAYKKENLNPEYFMEDAGAYNCFCELMGMPIRKQKEINNWGAGSFLAVKDTYYELMLAAKL